MMDSSADSPETRLRQRRHGGSPPSAVRVLAQVTPLRSSHRTFARLTAAICDGEVPRATRVAEAAIAKGPSTSASAPALTAIRNQTDDGVHAAAIRG